MPEDRRLAAIMFTDIVGYTALMGSDEAAAFRILKKNRNIQRPLIRKYHGEWLKEMGDGILASFNSASDAVRCASKIQNEANNEGILLRIGIHIGEVVFEGGDVLGDGVNVASRLEELAEKGGINISGAVFKEIKNKPGILTEFQEEKILKNVDEPVKIYTVHCEIESEDEITRYSPQKRVNKQLYYVFGSFILLIVVLILIWLFYLKQRPFKKETAFEQSIAVLPFKDLSPEMNNQYFCDGIMEGILNNLSKIRDLRVASRSSTEKYRETIPLAKDMAKELNVTYLLEASVFKTEERIRVTVQLINAINDEHIWSDQYDRQLTDVFEVMSDISQQVASEVDVAISPDVKKRIESLPTNSIDAYDLYLRGREYHTKHRWWFTETESHINNAIHLYQQAIDIDPEFALAYVWLGIAIHDQSSPKDYLKDSFGDTLKYFADQALSANPDFEEIYWLLGQFYYVKGEFDQSIRQIRRAIELNPNFGDAYLTLAQNYKAKNDYIDAIFNYEKARKLKEGAIDYPIVLREIGNVYHDISYYSKAENYYNEILYYDSIEGYTWLFRLARNFGEWDKMKYYGDKVCSIDSNQNCYMYLTGWYDYNEDYINALKFYEKSREKELERDLFIFSTFHEAFLLYKLNRMVEAKNAIEKQIIISEETIRLKRPYATGAMGGMAQYAMAGMYALQGEKEMAYKILHEMERQAFSGWYTKLIQIDALFENLHGDDEFKAIIRRQEKKFADIRAEIDRLDADSDL